MSFYAIYVSNLYVFEKLFPITSIVHGTDDRTIKMSGGIEYMSTQQIAQYWAKVANCNLSPFDEPVNFDERLAIFTTVNCEQTIELVLIKGMGHNWSDNMYDTPQKIWEFFGFGQN